MIFAVFVKLGSRAIQTNRHIRTGHITGCLNRFDDDFQRAFVGTQCRRKTAFITHGRGQATVMQNLFQVVEHFGTATQRFTEAACGNRNNHEFLNICTAFGMRPAVDDVHHRHGHFHARRSAEITVKRQAGFFRCGFGNCNRTIQVNHGLVNESLLGSIKSDDGFGNFGVDELNRFQHTFTEVALFVAIAQLYCLLGSGGRTGRHCRTAHHARFQQHIGFHSGIATRIQNLTRYYVNDCTHFFFLRF